MLITIDPEFQALIPPLAADERAALETSLQEEGCRDALIVWRGTLIDGHNRYDICQRYAIPFDVVEKEFASRADAMLWMIQNQFGRRNLTTFQRSELALKMKAVVAEAARERQIAGGKDKVPQNSAEPLETRDALADQAGVSHDTINKVERIIRDAPEELKASVRRGDISIHRADVLTKTLKDATPEFVETVQRQARENGGWDAVQITPKKSGAPDALQMSISNEWYTPSAYVESARRVMGGIDLDPASNPIANKVIQAAEYYTIETDGLAHDWHGRVWLNPPYGRDDGGSNQARWSARLIQEYESGNVCEAVLLVNAVTDREWFQPLWNYPICFTDHRIRFYDENGEAGQPTHGNALIYFGSKPERFIREFIEHGVVVPRVERKS